MSFKSGIAASAIGVLFGLVSPSTNFEAINNLFGSSNNIRKVSLVSHAVAQTRKSEDTIDVIIDNDIYTLERTEEENFRVYDRIGVVTDADIVQKAIFVQLVYDEYISGFSDLSFKGAYTAYFEAGKYVQYVKEATASLLFRSDRILTVGIQGVKSSFGRALLESFGNLTNEQIVGAGKKIVEEHESIAKDLANASYDRGLDAWKEKVSIAEGLARGRPLTLDNAERFLKASFLENSIGFVNGFRNDILTFDYDPSFNALVINYVSAFSGVDINSLSENAIKKKAGDAIDISLQIYTPIRKFLGRLIENEEAYVKARLDLDERADIMSASIPESAKTPGSMVVFRDWKQKAIFLVDITNRSYQKLISGDRHYHKPSLSPDGKVAFLANRDGQIDVYLMDPATKRIARLTNSKDMERHVAWSKDSRRLVITSKSSPLEDGDLHVMNLYDDACNLRIGSVKSPSSNAFFSPDNSQIMLHDPTLKIEDGMYNVYNKFWMMNDDGGELRLILDSANLSDANWFRSFMYPDWSKNGELAAIMGEYSESQEKLYSGIVIIDPGSGDIRKLVWGPVEGDERYNHLRWSQDGRYLFFWEKNPYIMDPQTGQRTNIFRSFRRSDSDETLQEVSLTDLLGPPEIIGEEYITPEETAEAWYNALKAGDINRYFGLDCGDSIDIVKDIRKNGRGETEEYWEEMFANSKLEIRYGETQTSARPPKKFDWRVIPPWYIDQREFNFATVYAKISRGDLSNDLEINLMKLGPSWKVIDLDL